MTVTAPRPTGRPTDEPAEALFREAKQRERRRRLRYVGGAVAACLVVTLSAVAAVGGFSSPQTGSGSGTRNPTVIGLQTQARDYQLPSDGWKPGDGRVLAGIFGRFDATLTPSGACGWMSSPNQGYVYLWPAGYQVRFNPTELLSPSGKVVARAGEEVNAGGGFYDPQSAASLSPPPAIPNYCGKAKEIVLIESSVLAGRGPA